MISSGDSTGRTALNDDLWPTPVLLFFPPDPSGGAIDAAVVAAPTFRTLAERHYSGISGPLAERIFVLDRE